MTDTQEATREFEQWWEKFDYAISSENASGHVFHSTFTDGLTDREVAEFAWQAATTQSDEKIARLEEEAEIICNINEKLNKQLASAELSNKQLREALDKARNGIIWYSENSDDADDSDTEMLCEIDAALAQPISTEALDAYVAEKMADHIGQVAWEWESFGTEPGYEYEDDHWFTQWSRSKPIVTKENKRFIRNVMPLFYCTLPPAPDKE